MYGTVVKWLPPDLSEGDPSLFLVRHDDGDREELEQNELETALKMDPDNDKIKAQLKDAQLTWEADWAD